MRQINFILPRKWLELSNKQLLYVAKLFQSNLPQFKFLAYAAMSFLGIRIKKISTDILGTPIYILKSPGEKPYKLTLTQMHSVATNLEWLFSEVTELRPLRKIRRAKPVNYRLYKTQFIQFLTAENFYAAYKTTGKIQHLNELVATLYQKPDDVFNESLVKRRARYFRWSSQAKKYTVFLWYSGFRWYVAKECPNLFSSSGSGKELNIKEHILSMIRGLTDGDVTKDQAVQYKVDTWTALYELDAKAKQVEEIRRKTPKK